MAAGAFPGARSTLLQGGHGLGARQGTLPLLLRVLACQGLICDAGHAMVPPDICLIQAAEAPALACLLWGGHPLGRRGADEPQGDTAVVHQRPPAPGLVAEPAGARAEA